METPTPQSSNTTKIVSTVVALALIIVLVTWFMKKDETTAPVTTENVPTTENTPSTETTPNQNNGNQDQPAATTRRYTNGSFNATGNYVSPAGTEEVAITLVITDDKIASASFQGKASNPTTEFMQGKFKEGFEALVVGKSVDEVSLTVVNGSSLTPKGFMDALKKIKAEAKNS